MKFSDITCTELYFFIHKFKKKSKPDHMDNTHLNFLVWRGFSKLPSPV